MKKRVNNKSTGRDVDKLLYFPIDEHEEKMFKELKAKRTAP